MASASIGWHFIRFYSIAQDQPTSGRRQRVSGSEHAEEPETIVTAAPYQVKQAGMNYWAQITTVSLQRQREKFLVRLDQVFVAVFRYRAGVFDLHRAPAGFVV